jgi:hypothetical protein
LEVIFIDPNYPVTPSQSITSLPYYNSIYLSAIFATPQEQADYLASLDSDTREYVVSHTSEFRTREDIDDCIRKLHGGS